jgi:hypothetical protein
MKSGLKKPALRSPDAAAWAHSQPDPVISLFRRLSTVFMAPVRVVPFLALPLLALPLLLAPASALADGGPATEAEMNLYTRIAAVNVCISRGAGVDFDKAVGIAGETIAQLIQGQHGGRIAQVGSNPLSIDDLRKGAINSAVLGAAEICPKEVPADVMAKVQAALKSAPAPKNPAPKAPASK